MNLTPVEKYDGIYFKRDDLFCPYGDVNGGKVRQTIELIKKHKHFIRGDAGSAVNASMNFLKPV